jgi:competence protein ComEA
MDTMRRVVVAACAALLFVPIYLKSRPSQDIPAHTAFHVLSSGRISVKVSGDVLHSGIYELPANSLAGSVIKMAMPSQSMKPLPISQATRSLSNGSAVIFTVHSDGSSQITVDKMTVSERLVLRVPLDISRMSEADFDRLSGIGPTLAKRIVEYRQNNGGTLSADDLAEIEGIGEKKYKKIRPYFQPL